MSEKIQKTQEQLKELGYYASEELSKLVMLFEASGKRDKRSIPTLLLQGKSGAGKTFLAETFAKLVGADEKFVQCFPRMGTENFQYDVNIEGVLKQDANQSVKPGILLQTLEQSKKGPVVLVIDELDKARPEVDSFLLDFLENGRLTTGTDTYEKGQFPIYTFITSNDKREIDDALINRSKKVEVPRPDEKLFLEILGLPEDHYLSYVYRKCPNFSIRQAKQYMEDLGVLGVEIDEDALSQYLNLDELEVVSIADLEKLNSLSDECLEVEEPDLSRCRVYIDSNNEEMMMRLLHSPDGNKFKIYSDERNPDHFCVDIDTLEQLQCINSYRVSGERNLACEGWFEYEASDEELDSDDVIWAENVRTSDQTRFGIKIIGNKMFRIARNNNSTFVYLDSYKYTLEQFLNRNRSDASVDFGTGSTYDEDDGRY